MSGSAILASDVKTQQSFNLHRHEVTDSKEEIRLIWFSNYIDDAARLFPNRFLLEQLDSFALFYTDLYRCMDFIRSTRNEKLFLILSHPFSSTILSEIRHFDQVVMIFLLVDDREAFLHTMDEDHRIIGAFVEEDRLAESIRHKMRLVEKQAISISLFDEKQKVMRELSKESGSFLWYELLTHTLRQQPHDDQSKEHMIDAIKSYYQMNKNMLDKIDVFQVTYTSNNAIEYYTDEGFLYNHSN